MDVVVTILYNVVVAGDLVIAACVRSAVGETVVNVVTNLVDEIVITEVDGTVRMKKECVIHMEAIHVCVVLLKMTRSV
jgi:hypothetical protein